MALVPEQIFTDRILKFGSFEDKRGSVEYTQNRIYTGIEDRYIDFGKIRPLLLQNFLIPEIVDDWILYRDVAGDGIHALVDRKTALQGLPSYSRGGTPVYEFSRFYRKFMEDKVARKKATQNDFQKMAMKTLSEQLIQQQLAQGRSAQEILDHIMNDDLLNIGTSNSDQLLLPKKKA